MRLTQLLMVWPKKRPNGYIWSGKHRMVLKVQPWHLKGMDRDIYRVSRAILKGLALASEEVDRDIYRVSRGILKV
jgi:hypothetical protein